MGGAHYSTYGRAGFEGGWARCKTGPAFESFARLELWVLRYMTVVFWY